MHVLVPEVGVDSTSGPFESEGLRGALVVRAVLLGYERSSTSTLVISNCDTRCIARELLMINSETVTLGIGIDEETSLEEGIGRRLNVRNHVGRCESQLEYLQHRDVSQATKIPNLLNLVEVVLGIPVQDELADRSKRKFPVGPDFGDIE